MKKITLLSASALGLLLVSCSNSQFDGFTKAENGLHYKFFNHDENGTTVKPGDKIYMSYYITNQKNDSLIIDSRKVSNDGSGYVNFGLKKSSFVGSFEDGMLMMAKGDSAAFIASADSFFLKTNGMNELPPGIKPGEYLKAVFKIKDIMPAAEVEAEQKKAMAEREAQMREAEAREMPDLQRFLTENKINVKPTASGLYYVEVKKGTGASPKSTDIVKVHYTGKFLDGKVFDSSVERGEPVEFPLNQVIMGWTEGLGMMKKGGKAKLVIPSAIAYGPNGRQGIPPYSPLYFEVELLDFQAAPAQPEMPMPQTGK